MMAGSLPPNWKMISFHCGNGENNETVSVERIVRRESQISVCPLKNNTLDESTSSG